MKKIVNRWYSLLLLVLSVTLTVFSFFAVVKIDGTKSGYSEQYYKNPYTILLGADDEIEVGVNSIISLIKNAEYVGCIMKANDTGGIVGGDELNQEILDKFNDGDETFKDAIGFVFVWIGYMESALEGTEGVTNDLIDGEFYSFFNMFLFILIPMFFIAIIVFIIIMIIKCLIKLITYLKKFRKETPEILNRKMEKFPLATYPIILMIGTIVLTMLGQGEMTLGISTIMSFIVLGVYSLSRLIKDILNVEGNKTVIIVKRSIALVSVIAMIIVSSSWLKIRLFNNLLENIYEMTALNLSAETLKLLDVKAAEKIVARNNILNMLMLIGLTVAGTVFIIILLNKLILRFRNRTKLTVLGNEGKESYKVLAIFILIFAIVPSLFTVNTESKLHESYSEGKFRVWYGEYDGIIDREEARLERLIKLKEEMLESDEKDEDTREKIEYLKEAIKKEKDKIKDLKRKETRPVTAIVFAVILVLSEFAYVIVSKKLIKNQKRKAQEVQRNPEVAIE